MIEIDLNRVDLFFQNTYNRHSNPDQTCKMKYFVVQDSTAFLLINNAKNAPLAIKLLSALEIYKQIWRNNTPLILFAASLENNARNIQEAESWGSSDLIKTRQ